MESDGSYNQWIKHTAQSPISSDNDTASTNHESGPQHYIPMASVVRAMRGILQSNAKIADDAKESIQECVSEFITVITAKANQRCICEYRKIITPEDIIGAIRTTGFNNFTEPLTVYLNKHRTKEDPNLGHPIGSAHLPFLNNRSSPQFVQRPPVVHPMQMAPPRLMGVYLTNQGNYGLVAAKNRYYERGTESFNGVDHFDPYGQWHK